MGALDDILGSDPGAKAGERIEDARFQQRKRNEEALASDFKALQSQKPEEVKDWLGIARRAIQLKQSDDPEARASVDDLLYVYGDKLRPHIESQAGADWWDNNYKAPDTDLPFWMDALQTVGKGVSPIFEYLDQWGASARSAVAGVESALTDDGVSAGDALRHSLRQGTRALDVTRAVPRFDGITQFMDNADATTYIPMTEDGEYTGQAKQLDQDGDGVLNFRESLGREADSGGRTLDVVDFIGQIVFDPTTYATFGGSSLAKVGMRAAEEAAEDLAIRGAKGMTRELAESLNQQIARKGFKALEEADQTLYRDLLRHANEMAAERGGRTTTRMGEFLIGQRRSLDDVQMEAIERGGQSGMRLGGTTVIASDKLGDLGRATGLLGDVAYGRKPVVGTNGVYEVVREGVQQGLIGRIRDIPAVDKVLSSLDMYNGVRARFGQQVAESLREGLSITRSQESEVKEIMVRLGADMHRGGLLREAINEYGGDADALSRKLNEALSNKDSMEGALHTTSGAVNTLINVLNDVRTEIYQATLRGMGYDRNEIAQIIDGAMRPPSNLADINEYIPRILTDAARHDSKLISTVKNMGGGTEAGNIVSNRTLNRAGVTDPKTADLFSQNEAASKALNDIGVENIPDLFETSVPNVMVTQSARAFSKAADVDLLEGITRLTGEDGVALAFNVPASALSTEEGLRKLVGDEEADKIITRALGGVREAADDDSRIAAFFGNLAGADEVSDELAARLGVDSSESVFLQGGRDPEFLKGVVTADDLMEIVAEQAGANVSAFRRVELPNGSVYRVHEDVASVMEEARRVFADPREVTAFGKFFDKANNLWAAAATVGGVNPAFHARNTVGNLFNLFISGVRDPSVLGKAAALQRTNSRIMKEMRLNGLEFSEAATKVADPGDIKILEQARRLGVLGDGRSLDILKESATDFVPPTVGNRFNPLSQDNALISSGRAVGNVVEGNARLAGFVDQLNKGATPEAAAAFVKKALFDYGDLTRFESDVLRRAARFYTFTRKNTALQAYILTRYPSRIANAEGTIDTLISVLTDDPTDEDLNAPPWMKNADIRSVNGQNAALDYDTPFASFMEMLDIPLSAIPDNSPEARFRRQENVVSKIDGLFSGIAPSVLDFLEEQRTGNDSFTGRTLTPPGTMRNGEDVGQIRDHWLFRAADTVLPMTSRFERQGRKLAGSEEDRQEIGLALSNIVLGLQAYDLGEDSQGFDRYLVDETLEEELQVLRDKGIPAPTLAEAREQGALALKNRVVEALMYSWTENEDGTITWDEDVRDDRLLNIIPKDVRKALNLPEPSSGEGSSKGERPAADEGSQLDLDIKLFDQGQIVEAIETYLGSDLTDHERATILMALPGAPSNAALEEQGLEPLRFNNRFIEDPEGGEEERAAQVWKEFEARANDAGLSVDYIREMRPRLSDFERLLNEAEGAGLRRDELWTYISQAKDEGGGGYFSRNDRSFINELYGTEVFDISETRRPTFTREDADKAREKAWQAERELMLFAREYGLPRPTPEQVRDYVLNVQMSGKELDLLGEANLDNAKNRKDIRSDEEKLRDASRERDASLSGIRFNRFGG